MKYLITILLLLSYYSLHAQVYNEDTAHYMKNPNAYPSQTAGYWSTHIMRLPDTTNNHPMAGAPGAFGRNADGTAIFIWDGSAWQAAGGGSTLTAGPFTTSNTQVGYDPGSNLSASQIIQKVWYGLKPPTATLTGGSTLEYANAAFDCTLNWSAHRQSNTATLSSIVVAGVTQSFSQPGQPGTVSGTQDVAVPANTNTDYSNVVTASDGQTATATTSFTWAPRKYYGFISDTTGIASGSQDAVIRALTSALSTSKVLNTNTGSPSGTQFYVYAYYSGLGTITNITFNGIPATDAITTVSKTFTTANGFSGTYKILYTTNGQTTSSDVIFQ